MTTDGSTQDRPLTWWNDPKGLVLADRDPSGRGGEPLGARTRLTIAITVVLGLAALALAVYIFAGHEVTVRRRRREYDVSGWVPLVIAAVLLISPWALARQQRTGGLSSRVFTASLNWLAVTDAGVAYRIPWEAVTAVTTASDPGLVRLDLNAPAGTFAVMGRAGASTHPALVLRTGSGSREAAVLDRLRTDGAARAGLKDPDAAAWANGAASRR